jgi:hypothetical protein
MAALAVRPPGRVAEGDMMKQCVCGCGGTTKGGDFLPGHDARHKSNLFKEARAGNADALAEIDHRNWMHLYDKNVAKRDEGPVRKSRSREALGIPDDGMPKTAHRLDWATRPLDEIPDDEIWDELTMRTVHLQRSIASKPGQFHFDEELFVKSVRMVHEDGTIEVFIDNGNCRTIRVTDCVGTW